MVEVLLKLHICSHVVADHEFYCKAGDPSVLKVLCTKWSCLCHLVND